MSFQIQNLLSDWSLVKTTLDKNPSTEMLMLMYNYFEANGKMGEFLQFVVEEDVKRAETPQAINLSDRGPKLSFSMLATDLGKKYLSHSLHPLLKEINESERFVDGKGKDFPTCEQDVLWILQILERYNKARVEFFDYCPIIIRETPAFLLEAIRKKWPHLDAELTTSVLLSRNVYTPCFLCAADLGVIDRDEFKLRQHAVRALNLAADILTRTASGELYPDTAPFGPTLNPVIKEKHPLEVGILRAMVDPQTLAKHKQIIEASTDTRICRERVQASEMALRSYLSRDNREQAIQAELARKTAEEKLKRDEEATDWMPRLEQNGVSIHSLSDETRMDIMRGTVKLKTSMENAFKCVHNWYKEKDFPLISDVELVEEIDDCHADYQFKTKFPFPFTSRDWLITRWDTFGPNRSVCLGYSISRDDTEPSKKYVRGQILSNAIVLEKLDSEHILLKMYLQADYKLQVPLWLVNKSYKSYYKVMYFLKKRVESINSN